jgi:hypothetical protein
MDKMVPCFVRHNGAGGPYVTFVTMTHDGKKKELSMWDLLNKHGADEVLRMRERYPEIEEKP